MLATLLAIIAPVFLCVGIGAAWGRSGRGFDLDMTTTLITNVTAPCLIFHTLANQQIGAGAFSTMVGATGAVLVASGLISAALLALLAVPQRAFLPALVFPNTGNVGLPLNLLAFGDTGLALAVGVFTVYSVSQLTIGLALASGQASLKALARVPILYALPPALAFMIAGEQPPEWLNATTRLLGDVTIPMMLIALGVSLARLRVHNIRRSLGLSAARLAIGFAVGVGVAAVLDLDPTARAVLIVQSAMPSAVFNYLFAQRYQTEPAAVAGIVMVSTVLSFVSLPLLLWFVL